MTGNIDYQCKSEAEDMNDPMFDNSAILRFFEEISAIPRASFKENKIADYLVEFARQRGLWHYRDELNNVVIKKPGSAGAEDLPPVMLQGHTDMVCEKNIGTLHDFDNEGIKLIREGNFLRADGTTLGADDGVAVAYMLALLDDPDAVHPPLECVFTVQEEVGLTGAEKLDPSVLQARTLINLDGSPFGTAVVSCAGGLRAVLTKNIKPSAFPLAFPLRIGVRGLEGGHSGIDIHRGRGNSIKLLGRILLKLLINFPVMEIGNIEGGAKDNAIPRESDAFVFFMSERDLTEALELLSKLEQEIREELHETDPHFRLEISRTENRNLTSIGRVATDSLIRMLSLAPDGVLNRSSRAGGFVVSSINLGVIRTDLDKISVTFSLRSSEASLQDRTKDLLTSLADSFGFSAEFNNPYPGWKYAENSPVRDAFVSAFRDLFGRELEVLAIHAGLECGLFSEKLPGLDAISLGPTIHDFHTPHEKLDLVTFGQTYSLLVEVLRRMTKNRL